MQQNTDSSDELRTRTEVIGDQLRAKIASKFQTSTFLAGFAATILSIEITLLWQGSQRPGLLPISVAALVGALILYVAAIIKLDELTMPKRFWDEDPTKQDPAASQFAYLEQGDLWELHKRMLFFWHKLTMVATALAAVSLISLLAPWQPFRESSEFLEVTAVCAGIAAIAACGYLFVIRHVARTRFNPLLRPCD
jgi:hypothetical protein